MKHSKWLMALLVVAIPASAQKKADRKIVASLQSHIAYLSDDKLEGRRTGTPGEQLAASYIAAQMKQAGLAPKGDSGYLQIFPVDEGRLIGENTTLLVNKTTLHTGGQFVPMPFSAQKNAKGDVLKDVNEADNIWLMNIKDFEANPHTDPLDIYRQNARQAAESGATGVIFYNGTESAEEVQKWCNVSDIAPLPIPVLWAGPALSKTLQGATDEIHIEMAVAFSSSKRTGTNVVGYIDNKAPNTIVIGAHYDHLGHNEDHNGLGTGQNEIYHGADDNASGTAALLELARQLKTSKLTSNNYLFVAFSGEELGLFGSKYFVEHSQLANVNYMINMDMIGRLDTQKGLQVGGIGTSPAFPGLLKQADPADLPLLYDSSGTGPSDHTSFYRKNIPVLFFFTGTHADYHKPSDIATKISLDGELKVIRLVYDVVDKSNNLGKLAFTKTREAQTGTSARFTVTLGIMPDYTWRKTGVRIDGISDGRPAQKAGLVASDVIIKLGKTSVTNLEDYMQALSSFKKGDHTTVVIKRGETEKTFEVQF